MLKDIVDSRRINAAVTQYMPTVSFQQQLQHSSLCSCSEKLLTPHIFNAVDMAFYTCRDIPKNVVMTHVAM